MRTHRSAFALTLPLLVVAGCDGSLSTNDGETDAAVPMGTDAPVPPNVDAFAPGSPDAYAPPMGACATIMCGANQRCDEPTASCVCLPGFVDSGASCTAAPPGDPSTRTTADPCAIWAEAHRATASSPWTMGAAERDGGSMPREAIDDTLRRITGFRSLVGFGLVVDNPGLEAQQQACAVMMYRNGSLSHSPPMGWSCYTAEGAAGAGSSNLALGTSNSAHTIDLHVDDRAASTHSATVAGC